MVLLSVATHNTVHRGRGAVLLVLTYDGSSCILCNHKATVQPCIRRQEWRQPSLTADKQVSPPLRYICQLSHSYCQEIGVQRQRLPVKVATAHYSVLVMENNGVICN